MAAPWRLGPSRPESSMPIPQTLVASSNVSLAARSIAEAGGIVMTMHSLSQRGGERVGILLANGFAQAGIPVRIVFIRDSGEAESELRPMLHEKVSVSSAGPPLRMPAGKYFERARALPFVRRQVRSFRPALVLSTINSLALLTARVRAPAKAGPAFVLKLTNPVVPASMGRVRRFYRLKIFDFAFSRFELALTLSEADRRRMVELYPGRANLFRTVPNAYVTNDMLLGAPPKRSNLRRVLALGAMVRRKRLDLLLRAFALCEDRTATLTIIGDGPLRDDLHRLALSLGIADRVEMPGFTRNVVPWLRESDLFVLPSDYEGLPAVVLEALACAVPVVSTDSFESAFDLLGGLEGCLIVPIGNAEELANAIDHSLNSTPDPAALRRAARPYLIDDSVNAHIKELGRLVKGRTSNIVLQGVSDRAGAANDDEPLTERWGRVCRRAALVLGLLSAGWLLHDVEGLVSSPAQASTLVDDAIGAYQANMISVAMEARPELARYDRVRLAKMTGIRMPRLPTTWRVLDIEVFPRPRAVNLAVQMPDGTRLSIFGMKTHSPGSGYPIVDKRGRDSVVYWEEGDTSFAVVGTRPSRTLLQAAASVDPDGPAISA